MKVLVTGADGFIGSHLVEALVAKGFDVRAFVFYNSFNSWGWLDHAPKKVRDALDVFAGDIRDPHGVKAAMKGCDAVLHLAALMRELGTKRVVHTSTSEVYGTARFVPITEEHPLQGQSPYSASKIGADQLAFAFHASFGLPVVIARPFNTYGPRQSARAVIPTIIAQIAAGAREIKLGATSPTRDFSFVEDTCSAFIAVLESAAGAGEVVNFGANFEISVGETASLIAEVMGRDIRVVTDAARLRPKESEVERLWSDNAKASRLFGWRPAYAGREGFKRGLARTAEWFADPKNLGAYRADRYNI